MEQIYYTQCPVGYGLGASNGFQIKRRTAAYPLSGDFRQLGLRAFPGGGRTLAPPALRYRRDGDVAEVARLTPRAHEYDTERGPWGRPGGHFAHGLRLGPDELASICQWPAGLFDSAIWRRTDREPSRGRPPDEVELSPAALVPAPTFADVAPLAAGEDPARLARLLTAVAVVAREGRTLFLIDEPDRLGPRVALLTFALPEAFRADLTFSTYHDRPEELPGFRIQGTIPAARPNRPALIALGIVADLASSTTEPPIEPAAWASTLAGWLVRRGPVDEADWEATDQRARAARIADPGGSPWSDAWLDRLFGFPEASRDRRPPETPDGWRSLGEFASWSGRSGLGDEWARPRDPAWWLAAAPARVVPEARSALVAHATLRDAWRGAGRPAGWGVASAAWFRDVGPAERDDAIAALLRAAPKPARPAFARSLLPGLTPSGAEAVLARYRADAPGDGALQVTLEASAAVSAIRAGDDFGPLGEILRRARAHPGATSAILDAFESGLADRPDLVPAVAAALADAFDPGVDGEGREGLAWALGQGGAASTWLGPTLRPLLADVGRFDEWQALRDRTPEDLRPALARAVLDVARDPGLPDEAFRWGVERLVLPLGPRPHDPAWPGSYLDRTPSGLDLLRRLIAPEYRKLGVPAWLDRARAWGEVTAEQGSRIDSCLGYARALNSRDPGSLPSIHVPGVPPEERGILLAQMLKHVGGPALEGLPFVLDACRDAWPGGFDPGAPGLRAVAAALARCLGSLGLPPDRWLARLAEVLGRLRLVGAGRSGFEPDGLAAEVVAAAPRVAGPPASPWPLRRLLLRDPAAWPALAADIRRDLADVAPPAAPEVFDRWDEGLPKDNNPGRFFELFLNASDGPRMAAVVLARAADLRSLPPLPWWDHGRHAEGRDDLRDGYARIAPLAPLPEGRLFQVRPWVEGPTRRESAPDEPGMPGLSGRGRARWGCVVALTNFQHAGRDAPARWPIVTDWEAHLPLAALPPDDRYRFIAWVVNGLDEAEPHQLSRLASWMKRSGMKDPGRLASWADEIDGLAQVAAETRLYRARLVGELRAEHYRILRDDVEARGSRSVRRGSSDEG